MERRTETVEGIHTSWLEAEGPAPTLYVHGVPNSSDMWRPFLEATGGWAVDLPGFGESGKPADFPYSIEGYRVWLRRFASAAGISYFRLCVHDWGVVGLTLALDRPDHLERLALLNPVPLLPGYEWHGTAKLWRRRALGELVMGSTSRLGTKLAGRAGVFGMKPLQDDLLDQIFRHFDHGTQRAILKLYRSAPETALAAAGAHLDQITAPALVMAGDGDPYIPASFAADYATALGDEARVELVEGGDHWFWLSEPDRIDAVTAFLKG